MNRITHPSPSQASDYHDRDNVQWPLLCRAVVCIDERAWAGTALEVAKGSVAITTPKGELPVDGDPACDHYGTDQKKAPPNLTLGGARLVTPTGLEPMFST